MIVVLRLIAFTYPSGLCVIQVGFPANNDRYIYVLEAAGEALTQVVEKVHVVENEMPLADGEVPDYWIGCEVCGKYRKVSKEYLDLNKAIKGWHCGIEGSPVPLPKKGRYVFSRCAYTTIETHSAFVLRPKATCCVEIWFV